MIFKILDIAVPEVANMIAFFRHKDGTVTALAMVTEADAQFATNIQELSAAMAAKRPQS